MKKQLLIVSLSMFISAFCFGQALNLPVNFENTTPNYYALTDFGGNASEIIVDPTNPANHVAKSIKTATAELWAGTTVGGTVGFATPVPFAPGSTLMRVRVWSPTAGTPIRLKVEAANDPTISVETEAVTTVAAGWDTLVFNFSNQAAGTAPLNFANSYNKASIFFNFGTTGAIAGEKTYYWDDMEFYIGAPTPPVNLPVTFEDATLNYGLTDFGGNASEITIDPANPVNHVAKTIKTATAELWAGTTVGGTVGFANPVPFTATSTKMSVRVWSPTSGTPIRLKVEAANDPTISVETEANTTIASAWQILVFDFSNQAPGTAALNLTKSYNKASIFFNFGTTGAQAGEKTYYWDDMYFGVYTGVNNLNESNNNVTVYPNPAGNTLYIRSNKTVNKVAIYNALGALVKEYGNTLQSVNVSDLKTGVYNIKMTDANGNTFTSVFMKK
ncbi:MAG: T9SS type A sorting domain-containing protein [Bacteroidales bacterium]